MVHAKTTTDKEYSLLRASDKKLLVLTFKTETVYSFLSASQAKCMEPQNATSITLYVFNGLFVL